MKNVKQEIVAIANQIINNEIDIYQGSQILANLSHRLSEEYEELFLPFFAIESEGDDLFLDSLEPNLSPDGPPKPKEVSSDFPDPIQTEIIKACHNLIKKFGQ